MNRQNLFLVWTIGVQVFGMWCYVERTRTLNPGWTWRRSVFLWNKGKHTPHKEVWYPGGLKPSITTLWKPQKSKIHCLLYTKWQSKSLHYKTFYNTKDLTFHNNKIISLHIKAQNLIAQIPKLWPSGEHWQTHNQCMYFSLQTIQIFTFESHWQDVGSCPVCDVLVSQCWTDPWWMSLSVSNIPLL